MHQRIRPTCATRRSRRRFRGQSMVELCVILPFMIMIMMGLFDTGRLVTTYITLQGAVREGSAYGARNPGDSTGARTAVFSYGVPSSATVTVSYNGNYTVSDQTGDNAGTVTVVASQSVSTLLGQFTGSRVGIVTIHASAKAKVMI